MASRAVEYTDMWWLIDESEHVGPDDAWGWVEVVLRYDDQQPFEVVLLYENADDVGVCHHFSRDLLGAGLGTHAGGGLVQVWPHTVGGDLYVALTDPDNGETWCFLAPRRHVQDFVTETLRLVPRDKESWFLAVPDDVAELELLEGRGDEWT